MTKQDDRSIILGELCQAILQLQTSRSFAALIPEVRTNLVYALPQASTIDEVAGIEGRITIVGGLPRATGYPTFGASRHLARAILELLNTVPGRRAAINILYSLPFEQFLQRYCQERGLQHVTVERSSEPLEVQQHEGRSLPWRMQAALRLTQGVPPDVLCESGGVGKEAMTLLFSESPLALLDVLLPLAEAFAEEA